MRDKNGRVIETGMSVVDVHGRVATMTNVSGVDALMFDIDGNIKYAFPSKLVESEFEIVESANEITS